MRTGKYDLEERTFQFAKKVARFVRKLPRTISNIEYSKQVVRASGSVGANYIEVNESLSKKDFSMRIKISRKEAKETAYWLRLSRPSDVQLGTKQQLMKEADELKRIFSSLIDKSELSDN